jgi:hypothetical protein
VQLAGKGEKTFSLFVLGKRVEWENLEKAFFVAAPASV